MSPKYTNESIPTIRSNPVEYGLRDFCGALLISTFQREQPIRANYYSYTLQE